MWEGFYMCEWACVCVCGHWMHSRGPGKIENQRNTELLAWLDDDDDDDDLCMSIFGSE